jgi:uncharacterized protein (TIGR03083 family)
MDSPEATVQLVIAESERLMQYLDTLTPEAWRMPSACDGWAVRDVVGHLIMGAELYLDVLPRGLHGDAAPSAGFPEAGTVNAASVAALVDQVSVARQESLGDQLLATFTRTSDQLQQLFARCRPQDWETRCYHPAALLPVRTFVDMWLTELVMHGWDIRSRLTPDAHLTPESFPTFLEMFTGAFGWFRWTLAPGVRRPAAVRYRFEVTGPVPLRTDLVVDGEQARLEPVTAAQAHMTFRCATEPFILLLYGRLPLPEAVAAGHIAAAGDAELIPLFAQSFRGM